MRGAGGGAAQNAEGRNGVKKKEVQIGRIYAAKISGRVVPVKVTASHDAGGWTAENLRTGHPVRIRSAAKLRYPCDKDGNRELPENCACGQQAVGRLRQDTALGQPGEYVCLTCLRTRRAAHKVAQGWEPEGKAPAAQARQAAEEDGQ